MQRAGRLSGGLIRGRSGLMEKRTDDLTWQCVRCGSSIGFEPPFACDRCRLSYRRENGFWDAAPAFEPPGFTDDRRHHLDLIDSNHFWYSARSNLIERRLRRILGDRVTAILELGCGSGRFLPTLARMANTCVGVDGYPQSLEKAIRRATAATLIHADIAQVPLADSQFDAVVMLDVLEHVAPLPALKEAARLTRPGGMLLLSVPAFQFMWSQVDRAAGHRCRYSIGKLRAEIESSGWELVGHTHYQFLVFPLFAASRLLVRRDLPRLERSPPVWINGLLTRINGFEVRRLDWLRLPFGSSLIAWARKV